MCSRDEYERKAREKYDELQQRIVKLRETNIAFSQSYAAVNRVREINTELRVRLNEHWHYEVQGIERRGLHAVLPRVDANVPPRHAVIQRCRMQGLRHGQHVHAQLNRWCKGRWPLLPPSDTAVSCDCLLHIVTLLQQQNYLPVASELPVWNDEVSVCTAFDLLCIDANTAKWYLLELKTSTTGNTNRPQHFLQILIARELLLQAHHYQVSLPSNIQCLLLEVLPNNLNLLRKMPSYVVKQARLRYHELRHQNRVAPYYAMRSRNTRSARTHSFASTRRWQSRPPRERSQTLRRVSANWRPRQRR